MNTLSLKEISKLPKYAKTRAGSVYKIADNAYIDNVSGFGATKSHTEISTRGFVSVFPIDRAIDLFTVGDLVPNTTHIQDLILAGTGIAAPQLYLDIENYMSFTRHSLCKIIDQSGLETLHALKNVGVETITVQVILLGYSMKNIEDTNEFFSNLSQGVVTLKGKTFKGLVNFI